MNYRKGGYLALGGNHELPLMIFMRFLWRLSGGSW